MDITLTAKLQIKPKPFFYPVLMDTMRACTNACNYVADYIYKTHDLKHSSLNKVLYYKLRDKFNLRSQMAQSVLKTVIAKYKTILEIKKMLMHVISLETLIFLEKIYFHHFYE